LEAGGYNILSEKAESLLFLRKRRCRLNQYKASSWMAACAAMTHMDSEILNPDGSPFVKM
jgi:hypothetical protein